MKSLVGEFTQNEKWSVKGVLMGECWYKDCCVSEHMHNLRCGKPEVESGDEKMRILIRSEEVQRLIMIIGLRMGSFLNNIIACAEEVVVREVVYV